PAIRATSSTSPFARRRSRTNSSVAGCIRTHPLARAVRRVISLPETSTIRLAPVSSKCDSSLMLDFSISGRRMAISRPSPHLPGPRRNAPARPESGPGIHQPGDFVQFLLNVFYESTAQWLEGRRDIRPFRGKKPVAAGVIRIEFDGTCRDKKLD